ncbi:carboxylesterase family protein [Lentzea waywayandensis]|uniref:carboxylesterase family protein n=1 Tax=Lentzea waywayandensis TaxID=84724 RepID=UPI001FE6BDE3|nr:carboxylesterase family protein [Lentzea waywayandensis]
MTVRIGPIRYATATRFGTPVRSLSAESSGQICPQPRSRLDAVMGPPLDAPPQGEDCLNLSITTPALDDGGRPVLVWLHGGGFSSGAGLLDWYDGTSLSEEGDVVVVSVNYRLGAMGFLVADGVSDGNLGLLDQVEALRWVRDNIASFGGDPAAVTVFGQSAGAMSIQLLLDHPERLFRRAILQSAPHGVAPLTRAEAAATGAAFSHLLEGDLFSCSPAEILAAQAAVARRHTGVAMPFRPVATPWKQSDLTGVEIVHGWNADEMTAFGGAREEGLFAGHDFTSRLKSRGARVFTYYNAWRPAGSAYGATHCVELPLLLGFARAWAGSPLLGDMPWEDVDRLGRQLRQSWISFARKGIPCAVDSLPVTWSTAA